MSILDDYDQMPFSHVEFADNPDPKCACAIVLDISGSMQGEPIAALNQGTVQLATALKADRLAAKRVDLAVVTFGGTVNTVAEFASATDFNPQPLTAKGGTPMGEAIVTAIDLVTARQAQYRQAGISTYRPWIFLITDGAPTDDIERAVRLVREGEERNSFSFFAVGVDGADMNVLARLSAKAPVQLRGLAFGDMFQWLSSSLSAVSRSSVGSAVQLSNPAGPQGWGTIV